MAVYSNLPTFTYVKWDNMMIAYNGQVYPIQNSYTNNKYVYFDSSNPYQLLCTNEKKAELGGRYLIIINEKGIHTLVPQEDLVITFDGDNSDLIAEKIYGIYETNKELGDRFVSVETNLEGVKTTVGRVEAENNKIKETVSVIDQKADQISQEVKNVEKVFNESQENIDLRERLNKSIIEMNSSLGIFKSYFGDIKTGSITEKIKVEINTHIDIVIKNKDAMILQVNRVEVLMEEGGFTDKFNSLNSAKTAAINAIDNLVTLIRSAISDNIIVPSDITIITDAFGKAATKVTILKNSCDDCIFLGTGGSVVEELSRLDMKANGIILSVSKTEESLSNTLSVNKAQVQSQIKDLHSEILKFKQALKVIFEDGLVSEIEKGVINEHLGKLDEEKTDLYNLYNTYISDENLSEIQKESLKSTYDTFVLCHNNVKTKVNEVVEDGFINEAEIAQVESELLKYEDQSNQLLRSICNALDDIEMNRNYKAVEDAKNEVRQEIEEVNGKVGDLDNTINTTFKDNVLDEAERNSIKQNLNTLTSEKTDVDNQYNQLYKNPNLSGQLKVDFKSAYDDFVLKYNSLVGIINGILEKPTLIDDDDRTNMTNGYELMNTSLANFTTVANKVIEDVAKKEAELVKSQLDKDIEEVNDRVNNINISVGGALSDSEKIAIKQNLKLLEIEKLDIDKTYETLYSNVKLVGEAKTNLKSSYDSYVEKYDNLLSVINGILEKEGIIDETDQQNLNNAFDLHKNALGDFKEKYNLALDSVTNKSVEDMRESLTQDINEVNNAVNDLQGTMEGVFKDGILSESEKLAIKQNLQSISVEKTDIDKQYEAIYNNEDLLDPAKTNLKSAYDDYVLKYNSLVEAINNIINKPGIIGEEDKSGLEDAFNNHKTSLGTYSTRVTEAIDSIAKKKSDDAYNNSKNYTKSEIKILSDKIELKVERSEIEEVNGKLSSINNKVSSIETSLTGITSKVESVESKYGEVDGKVTELETWKKSAEQKITDEAIISTVSSQFYKKGETDSKYASQSQITQLANQISSKVDSDGVSSIIKQNSDAIRIGFNGIDTRTQIDSDGLSLFNTKGIKTTMLKLGNIYQYNGETGTFLGGYLSSRTRTSSNLGVIGSYYTKQWIVGRSTSWESDVDNNPNGVTDYFFINFVDVDGRKTGVHLATQTYAHGTLYMQSNEINNAGNVSCNNLSAGNNVSCYKVIARQGMQTNIWYNSNGAQLMRYDGSKINLGASINTNGFSVSNSSDVRLKKDIQYIDEVPYTNNESNLKATLYNEFKDKFKFATYRYKREELKDKEHFGFIAQDLLGTVFEKYILDNPNSECTGDDYLTYDLTEFATMVAGVLQEEINVRDKQIENLEARLNKLENI